MVSPVDPIIREARRVEEDVLYSAKRHFEAAREWNAYHLSIGIPLTVVAALTAGSVLSKHGFVAAVLAAVVTAGTALLTFLKPSERAAQHTQAGNAYQSLRNRTRIFREITCANPDAHGGAQGLEEALKKLSDERDDLNRKSPITSRRAFQRARKGITVGEADYEADR